MKCITAAVFLIAVAHCAYVPTPAPLCVLPINSGLHHGPHGPTLVQSNDHHSWTQAQAAASSNAAYWVHNNPHGWNPVLSPPPPSATFQDHQQSGHHNNRPAAMYVAANPGAVHKAPLPGHSVNQQSLNLAPAPGTGY
ncbi:hypothetical protein pipiens_012345 [Culex pipiens pipiens]|uniref:Cuticle protein n=1 Tax=Culex pipiens pipiens TaxID=38569 RepID=A0ABD1D349_CULPP